MGGSDRTDEVRVSPLQRGILLDVLAERENALHVTQSAWLIEGEIDDGLLEHAWRSVVDRHGALRTTIRSSGVEWPVQREEPPGSFRLDRRSQDGDPGEILDHVLAERREQGLDLEESPMRVTLVDVGGGKALMVWTYSHVLVDGWSAGLVAEEVMSSYGAMRGGSSPELPPAGSYLDYVTWSERRDLTEAEFFWAEQLSGLTEPTPLPTDGVVGRMKREASAGAFGQRSRRLSPTSSEALRSAARANRVTLAALVQASWAFLLSEYNEREETTSGIVVSGRPFELEAIETTVGMFANALPIRSTTAHGEAVLEAARRQHRLLGKVLTHQHAPLLQLRGWSEILRQQPLFLSTVNVQNQPFQETEVSAPTGITLRHMRTDEPPQFPLQITVSEGVGTEIAVDFLSRWLDEDRAEDVLIDLVSVLEAVAEDPSRTFGSISARGLEGRDRIRNDAKQTADDHALVGRGYRTSLEEIETLVERETGIAAAIVPYRQGDADRLAAYRETREDSPPGDGIRNALAELLPGFLVPDLIVEVDDLPRTQEGLLDRDRLPAVEAGQLQVAPRTEREATIAAIWSEALGVDEVGVFDNFFELGGESLAAMLISSKASQAIGMDVPMRLMLELQTVAAVAAALDE